MNRVIFLALMLAALLAYGEDLKKVDAFHLEDFSWVSRKLNKLPSFKSENVRYSIWVLGEGQKSVMTMAWDESEGTGKGYDTLYIDRNFNRDLTETDEKLFYANPAPKGQKPPGGTAYEDYVLKGVKEAGGSRVFDFKFHSVYNHDEIEYNSGYTVRGGKVNYTVSNLPWSMKLKWGPSIKEAPVYRLGGTAEPMVSYQTGGRRDRKRHWFVAGEDIGSFQAGSTMRVDVVVAHIGSARDVQLRFRGAKFPGVGKGIQGLRWGKGGYPVCELRLKNGDGSLFEVIPMNPGCP
ncbi:hypothetical protein ACFL4W_01160 [Planctomycetota bacterium]